MRRAALELCEWFLLSVLVVLVVVALWGTLVGLSGKCPKGAEEWQFPGCDDGDRMNGYWWVGQWIPGLIRNQSQFLRLPLVLKGRAVWYAPGVMEATAEARGLSLDGYLDGVAAMSCADVGLTYWIDRGDGWEGPFLVVDCPQLDDLYAIVVQREEVVEVGWTTAMRWGTQIGGWQVEVSRVGPGTPPAVELAPWFLERVKFHAQRGCLDPKPLYRAPSTWRIDGKTWVTFEQPDWPSEARFLEAAATK